MSTHSLRQLLSHGTLSIILAGCTLAPPPRTPTPEGIRVESTRQSGDEVGWTPRRSPGSWRYRLESNATVTLSRDSAPQQATQVGRTTLYTVTLAQNDGSQTPRGIFKLTGKVDSVALSTSNMVPRQSTGTNAPPHFTAELSATGHLTNLTSDAITSCRSGTDPLTAALQAVIVPLPQAVSVGTSWRDTISIATCRGRAPIITTVIRHYKVITDTTWQAQTALRIYRTDSLTVRSQSDTGATAMIVRGAGNATATLYVAASTGLLINARSQGSTRLTVVTGQSSFPFRQDATETITLIP